MMKSVAGVSALAVMLLVRSAPTFAHHSFAGFDMLRTETMSGTIARLDFAAPHARLVIFRVNDKGEQEQWQFMTGTPTQLLRNGFDPRVLRRGDKIIVYYHPARNRSLGGHLEKVVLSDGQVLIDPSASTGRAEQGASQ